MTPNQPLEPQDPQNPQPQPPATGFTPQGPDPKGTHKNGIDRAEARVARAEQRLARARALAEKLRRREALEKSAEYSRLIKQDKIIRHKIHQARLGVVRKRRSIHLHEQKAAGRKAEIAQMQEKLKQLELEHQQMQAKLAAARRGNGKL